MQDNNHQRIRQNTFDETSRIPLIKQRQHSFIQSNKHQQQTPSFHLTNIKKNFESPSFIFTKQSGDVVHRNNTIAVSSPSIIVTGYDSGN
jgi:hypothetical protein